VSGIVEYSGLTSVNGDYCWFFPGRTGNQILNLSLVVYDAKHHNVFAVFKLGNVNTLPICEYNSAPLDRPLNSEALAGITVMGIGGGKLGTTLTGDPGEWGDAGESGDDGDPEGTGGGARGPGKAYPPDSC